MGNYFSAEKTKQDFTREKKELPNYSKQSEIQSDIKTILTINEIYLDTNSDAISPKIYTNKNGDLILATSSGNTIVFKNEKQNPKNNVFTNENCLLLCNSDETSILNGSL